SVEREMTVSDVVLDTHPPLTAFARLSGGIISPHVGTAHWHGPLPARAGKPRRHMRPHACFLSLSLSPSIPLSLSLSFFLPLLLPPSLSLFLAHTDAHTLMQPYLMPLPVFVS